MRIKKLRLRNIRSYTEAELDFPEEGSILLSGNIGSGKSSVLLAIDFALFGLQRGELSGNALLRNGSDSGEVELALSIDGKVVVISRSLRRSSAGVGQDAGSITVNGETKQTTAVELKQEVLNLLNYPRELLSKSKSLIFRYTVYTPQEEMKQILLGDSEIRLNTLRKVFDIDKYKRIVENSKILSTHLRERKKEMSGRVADLPIKRQELSRKEFEVMGFSEERQLVQLQIKQLESQLRNKESEVKFIEESLDKVREIKLSFNQCDFEWRQFFQQSMGVMSDIAQLEQEVSSFQVPQLPDTSLIVSQIESIHKSIDEHEVKTKEFSNSLQDAKTKITFSQSLINQISQLNECPTCRQNVELDYKNGVIARENASIASLNDHVTTNNQRLAAHYSELTNLKEKKELLTKQFHGAELAKLKLKSFEEKKLQLEKLRQESLELTGKVKLLASKKDELSKLITDEHEIRLNSLKQERQLLLAKEKELITKRASIDTSIKSTTDLIESLRAEIQAKKKLNERMLFISSLRDWVGDSFTTMVESMERSVMMRVHGEFNGLFSKWFKILVDNGDFNVKLDEAFTPIVEQDGYDIEYQNLSGGEKTAAALAYRLALNQVTNSLVSTIKTKDLLILDEPTDGFSAEQLDHMRDILEQLNMGQIILVSHEEKIASMVDRVIRFTKENQRTSISE
ncbi:MAG: AAA family ATPase [archaeon]